MLKTEIVLLVVATFVVNFSSALYFHISETERKCFIEEIPDDTTVLGMYRHQSNVLVWVSGEWNKTTNYIFSIYFLFAQFITKLSYTIHVQRALHHQHQVIFFRRMFAA